jgi:hypothetical protein
MHLPKYSMNNMNIDRDGCIVLINSHQIQHTFGAQVGLPNLEWLHVYFELAVSFLYSY